MSGSLQIKGNRYYVVTRIPDHNGKVKSKWISTGISVEGNKNVKRKKLCSKFLAILRINSFCILTKQTPYSG
jgi:uncharacterized protein YpmB